MQVNVGAFRGSALRSRERLCRSGWIAGTSCILNDLACAVGGNTVLAGVVQRNPPLRRNGVMVPLLGIHPHLIYE